MADEVDRAQNEVDRSLAEAVRARKPAGPDATGYCHCCEMPVGDTQRWCDAGCRDQWEALTKRRA